MAPDRPHYAGECQRGARLEDLAGLRPSPHRIARPLYRDEDLGLELDNTVYALDSSTIDLSLNAFPWARFRSTKGVVKLHTPLDLQGHIPTFIRISDGKLHDVRMLDELPLEPGAIYVMDRAYIDFLCLFRLHSAGAFFVVRAKSNLLWRRRYSRAVDKLLDLRCDQTTVLTGPKTAANYPQPLRRVGFRYKPHHRTFHFLTNNFELRARTVADLYRQRWQVELHFRWLEQHLRIQRFLGMSENAVKTQIWIAVSVYVLIAILKKRLELPDDLYTILRALDLTPFMQVPLHQLFMEKQPTLEERLDTHQMWLLEN